MIYDGRNGYVSGNLNQAANTVLATIKGPITKKNWFTADNPAYKIIISTGATGTVALQGTNDIAYRSGVAETDFLPTDGATWTDIQAATSVTATGTITVEYEFLRLIIKTKGSGFVTEAWVRWY